MRSRKQQWIRDLIDNPRVEELPEPDPPPKPEKQHIAHHVLCGCGRRMMIKGTPRCWLCETKEPIFEVLDKLISDGIDTPREKLSL